MKVLNHKKKSAFAFGFQSNRQVTALALSVMVMFQGNQQHINQFSFRVIEHTLLKDLQV